jgi:hypothetical protein
MGWSREFPFANGKAVWQCRFDGRLFSIMIRNAIFAIIGIAIISISGASPGG